mgnify:CR=1 FL=1
MAKKRMTLSGKRSAAGLLFISPFLIGFIFLIASPLILYIVMSFTDKTINDSATGIIFTPVGFKNYYEALFVQIGFLEDVLSSLGSLLVCLPSIILYSFFIAVILNQKFKGRTFARAVFFLPVLIASGAAAIGQGDALVSSAMSAISGAAGEDRSGINLTMTVMDFLGTSLDPAFFRIINTLTQKIYEIVMSSGVQILIFLAGLQTISGQLYEAADIEGATAWEKFWKITLPMVSPLILVNCVYTIIDSMGNANNKLVAQLYSLSLEKFKYGLSSAMGTMYFGVIFLVLGILIFFISKGVFYENR